MVEFGKVIECLMNGDMDYVGQKYAFDLSCTIVYGFTFVGLAYCYWMDVFMPCFYSSLIGGALAMILCAPSWPMYSKNPLTWQPADNRERFSYDSDESSSEEEEEEKNDKNKKKKNEKKAKEQNQKENNQKGSSNDGGGNAKNGGKNGGANNDGGKKKKKNK